MEMPPITEGGGAGGGAGGGGNQRGKKQKREEGGREDEREEFRIINLLSRLCLSNTLQVRILRSVMITCYLMSSEAPLIVKGLAATKQYATDMSTANATEKARNGAPFHHIANVLILLMLQHFTEEKKAWLQNIVARLNPSGLPGWGQLFSHIRISKTYQSTVKKFEFCLRPVPEALQLETMVNTFVAQCPGARATSGLAPQGDLERQVQAWLDM